MRCTLVDDDPDFISIVRIWLWRLHAQLEIVAFASAADAMRFLASHRVDLLITDFKMPGANGLELVHDIRAREADRHLPIIVMSGEDIEPEALAAGADAFVSKRDLHVRLGPTLEAVGFGFPARRAADQGAGIPRR
jgi:CheY-like chemotaxis protein